MSIPTDRLLQPAPGWHTGFFFSDLAAEILAHPFAVGIAGTLLLLLAIGRGFLAPQDRPRLRAALVLLGVYTITFVARAELLSLGDDGDDYTWLALVGVLALCLGVVSVVALLIFDFAVRRLGWPQIMRDVTTALASIIALIALLARSGVNVLQLVTTSAVLTAVIGLALQDTLGNIIAGVALQLDSAIGIGDWIRLDDRTVGLVRSIRWRSTVIETKNGDLLALPNALLNRGVITRVAHSGLQHRQWVHFNAHLQFPPNKVIEVVLAALKDTPNVSTSPPPECLVIEFDPSSIKYVVRYRLSDYRPGDATDSEVRKRVWYALHRAEIEMPYPISNVYLNQVGPEPERDKATRDLHRRLRALGKIHFFAPLSDAERKTLAEGLRFMPFAHGEMILRQGESGASLYVLRDGKVSIRIEVDGVTKEIAQLGAGDCFGEMSLLTGAARSATVIAQGDVECYVIDRHLFEGIMSRNPPLAETIATLLAHRESELESQRKALGAEHKPQTQADLLGKIRRFFGLG